MSFLEQVLGDHCYYQMTLRNAWTCFKAQSRLKKRKKNKKEKV